VVRLEKKRFIRIEGTIDDSVRTLLLSHEGISGAVKKGNGVHVTYDLEQIRLKDINRILGSQGYQPKISPKTRWSYMVEENTKDAMNKAYTCSPCCNCR
jgi:hypothetical protein